MVTRALVLVGCLALAGCPRKAGPSQDAGPPPAPAERVLRVVGVSTYPPSRDLNLGGRILVHNDLLVWEAKPDGTLPLVAPLEAFAALAKPDGILAGHPAWGSRIERTAVVDGDRIGIWRVDATAARTREIVEGGALVRVASPKPTEVSRTVRWKDHALALHTRGEFSWLGESGGALPAKRPEVETALDMVAAADGSLVVLATLRAPGVDRGGADRGQKAGATPGSVVYAPDGTSKIAWLHPAIERGSLCSLEPSFDGVPFASCATSPRDTEQGLLLRFEGGAWSRVFAEARPRHAVSIAPDGSLWVSQGRGVSDNDRLYHCRKDAAECTPVTLDLTLPDDFSASYSPTLQSPTSEPPFASFVVTSHVPCREGTPPLITDVFARSDDDVWAMVLCGVRLLVLHSGPPREPALLLDNHLASLAMRNLRPAEPWSKKCDQAFVRLPDLEVDAGLAPSTSARRLAEANEILGVERDQRVRGQHVLGWELIEGDFGEERVAGIVLHRNVEGPPISPFALAVERLLDGLARDGGPRPNATCNLPVPRRLVAPEPR